MGGVTVQWMFPAHRCKQGQMHRQRGKPFFTAHFGVDFDEGALIDGEKGAYGPYRQSARKELYQVYARELVKKGLKPLIISSTAPGTSRFSSVSSMRR